MHNKTNIVWALILWFMLCIFVSSSFTIPIGDIEDFSWNATDKRVDISIDTIKGRIIFYKPDIFRIWFSSKYGEFSDNASEDIVVYTEDPIKPLIDSTTSPLYYLIKTSDCNLRVYKTPCEFGLFDVNNSNPVFQEESSPIDIDSITTQTFIRRPDEHFYGCGAWNGHYCLTDLNAPARYTRTFQRGDNPNPAPFYVSRLGYGALRNTWNNTGAYNFKTKVTTSHGENRFDCYYFYGPSLKKVLRGYTDITGKIMMPPIWGLEIGVLGYYTNPNSEFGKAVDCAKKWADNDIPIGWWYPNESHSNANINDIEQIVPELKALNMWCGAECGDLFRDLQARARCVRDWGVRGLKLDHYWIGRGGKSCFHALESVGPDGIEAFSSDSARSFLLTTAGWAGTQRFSWAWSGEQSGSLFWLKWHIPTITGACMSAMNGFTVGLAAIFDGTDPTKVYVRCWQWQMWMPYLYIIDGWSSPLHRMPWNRCPTYLPVLRSSMKLRTRLTPYIYTLCADAHKTGVSAQRPPMLEFPDDKTTWDEGTSSDTKCKQEYMLGPWFLIRPVYEKFTTTSEVRVWLPGTSDENWIDYWNGTVSQGAKNVQCEVGMVPDTYNPDRTPFIPVWVREGAIIPMWPEQYYNSSKQLQRPNNPQQKPFLPGPITIDVYPHRKKVTSFSMYEDDGLTREYKRTRFARTLINCDALRDNNVVHEVTIGAAEGDYTNKPANRTFVVTLHTGIIKESKKPSAVTINNVAVPKKSDSSSLVNSEQGYWWNNIKKGIVYVKTKTVPSNTSVKVSVYLSTGITVPVSNGRDLLKNFSVVYKSGKILLSFANSFTGKIKASIYSLQGKLIIHKSINVKNSKSILSNAGKKTISGTYLLRLEYKGKTAFRKVIAIN